MHDSVQISFKQILQILRLDDDVKSITDQLINCHCLSSSVLPVFFSGCFRFRFLAPCNLHEKNRLRSRVKEHEIQS